MDKLTKTIEAATNGEDLIITFTDEEAAELGLKLGVDYDLLLEGDDENGYHMVLVEVGREDHS